MERGIVLGPTLTTRSGELFASAKVESGLLRQAVLYWDRIDYPQCSHLPAEIGQDLGYLLSCGVARCTVVPMPLADGNYRMFATLPGFELLNDIEPGSWTLGQVTLEDLTATERLFPELAHDTNLIAARPARTVEIILNSALPHIPHDVPLAELLEFKSKREPELKCLRIAVDALFDDVLKSGEPIRAESSSLLRLQRAIRDVNACADRSWVQRALSSMKFDFQVPAALTSAAAGHYLGSQVSTAFGVPGVGEAVGAGLGAALSAIKLEGKLATVPVTLGPESRNFAYLYHVRRTFWN